MSWVVWPSPCKTGKATLKDGTIAGSAVNVFTCMKRAVSFGVPLEQAVAAATQNPANSIGVSDQYGVIRPGAAGDLLLTTPRPCPLPGMA